jgi:hypothetical protein
VAHARPEPTIRSGDEVFAADQTGVFHEALGDEHRGSMKSLKWPTRPGTRIANEISI